jgi:hypothetical protein
VNLLDNGPSQRAYCYHPNEGGNLVIRNLPTGEIVNTVKTPFHHFGGPEEHLVVSNLGDATISGENGSWMMAFTEDLKLHSIDLTNGAHRIEWQYQRKSENLEEPQEFVASSIIGLRRSPKVLVQDDFGDVPLHVWDQSIQTMKVVGKAPRTGWQGGWGNLAWNFYCNDATLWNIETLRQIPIPRTDDPILEMTCDGDQSTLFVARGEAIDVFRLIDAQRAEPIHRLLGPIARELVCLSLVMSLDERTLFVHGWRKKHDDERNQRGTSVMAIFDVSDLTK